MTSRERSHMEDVNDPAWQWRRLGLWSVVPGIWLSVWLVAVALFAEENATGISTEIARLGWLPTLIASVATSLYLANRTEWLRHVTSWRVNVLWVMIATLFVGTQVYLGGWRNGFVAILILVAGELQRRLTVGPMSLTFHQDQLTQIKSRSGECRSDECGLDKRINQASADDHPSNVDRTVDHSFVPIPELELPTNAKSGLFAEPRHNDEASDNEASDTEAGERTADLDDAESDEEPDALVVNWIQQMTRTACESSNPRPASDSPELGDQPNLERVEWFCRHHWRPTEVLVDLHAVFQPAFRGKPNLRVEVVEGSGSVSIGDGQGHGARLQLKRPSPNEGEEYAIVWLEAIGPV